MGSEKSIRIGGAGGFWGEALHATPQLLAGGNLDYLVFDYLAEITMSIMARARAKNPDQGYATDFVTGVMAPHLKDIAARGVKVISNAGGVNPAACGAAVRELVKNAGLDLKVAVVAGDDLLDRAQELAGGSYAEMFSGAAFPPVDAIASINAYLGAFPIADALDRGADIVITGRVVDSAVTLGACIHAFGWARDDHDLLAAGTLAGHIIECGPQATGGNFTDWRDVADDLDAIGYPIADVSADGSFICSKPPKTGGKVSVGTVCEQMVYEIGDPQAYLVPDVVCDFSEVQVTQTGPDEVRVTGARGLPAPDTYKVCTTYSDGWRGGLMMAFIGLDAADKARTYAETSIKRAQNILRQANAADFTETSIEIIGDDSQYGAAAKDVASREVVMKLAAKHPDARGIGVLLKEVTGLALATPAGLTSFAGGRPKPSPVVRLFSFALPKNALSITVDVDGDVTTLATETGVAFHSSKLDRPTDPAAPSSDGSMVAVPLVKLAWARSGDKGDKANIGIIARDESYLPYISASMTDSAVASRFAHFLDTSNGGGKVERFFLPGSNAFNFLMDDALGGGGVASLRADPQAKAYAQILLDHPVSVPADLAGRL
ncbi:acyclic terpene utilization AtuA family protein [Pyruvatibacter sp.]|uniref:acyclic terpene utilization AtuA family protein n=1 Tax=Pyruvatibacter sp. TaxID=1981328 RepID=UPI003265886A